MRPAAADDPRLQLEPPAPRTYVAMAVMMLALPLLLELVVSPVGQNLSVAGPLARVLGAGIVLAVMGVVYAGIALLMRRHRVRVDSAGIEIATTFYGRRLAWADLRLDAARIVSLDERPELRPALKSNGMALLGFRSGWFRTRRLERLFVATAGGRKLLWLPTRRGYDVLLQPRNPAALLEAIKAAAAATTAPVAPGRPAR